MEEKEGDEAWEEMTLSIDEVTRMGLRWLPAISVLSFLPLLMLHGFPDITLPESVWSGAIWAIKWTAIAFVVYAISALLHEGIHVIAMFVFAGAPPSSIRFGARPRDGVLYVHTDRPMSANAYRGVLLLPAVMQGLLPIAYGTLEGTWWIVLYGYVMLVSAIGDLSILQLIRPLGGDDVVRDHPTGIGCLVRTV